MKKAKQNKQMRKIQTKGFECIGISNLGGCGEGWTCDRCPNVGCPANERN
jgi:hypothetical protein